MFNTKQILRAIKLDPNTPIFQITQGEAVQNLLVAMEDLQLSIKGEDITKVDWQTLLESYGEAVITYHPENYHQERAVFLKNEKMLRKYGLTNEDFRSLDFS